MIENPMKAKLAALLLTLSAIIGTAPARAGDWYRWRGPEQNGVSREKNLEHFAR